MGTVKRHRIGTFPSERSQEYPPLPSGLTEEARGHRAGAIINVWCKFLDSESRPFEFDLSTLNTT